MCCKLHGITQSGTVDTLFLAKILIHPTVSNFLLGMDRLVSPPGTDGLILRDPERMLSQYCYQLLPLYDPN